MEGIEENKSTVTSYRLSQDNKNNLKQQLKNLGMPQEEYFNKVVLAVEMENVNQNSFFNKDITIIQSNLDTIMNSFINIAESKTTLINNKDAELEGLNVKYNDLLSDKESCITEYKKELEEIYLNLNLVQIENENHKNELLYIKLERNKGFVQLGGKFKSLYSRILLCFKR